MKKLIERIEATTKLHPGEDILLSLSTPNSFQDAKVQRIQRDYWTIKKAIKILDSLENRLSWAGISRTSYALRKYLETGLREDQNDGFNWNWKIQGESGFFRFSGSCGYGSWSVVTIINSQVSIDIGTCGGHWINIDVTLDLQALSFDNTEKFISVETDGKESLKSWNDSEVENFKEKRIKDIKKLVISTLK